MFARGCVDVQVLTDNPQAKFALRQVDVDVDKPQLATTGEHQCCLPRSLSEYPLCGRGLVIGVAHKALEGSESRDSESESNAVIGAKAVAEFQMGYSDRLLRLSGGDTVGPGQARAQLFETLALPPDVVADESSTNLVLTQAAAGAV